MIYKACLIREGESGNGREYDSDVLYYMRDFINKQFERYHPVPVCMHAGLNHVDADDTGTDKIGECIHSWVEPDDKEKFAGRTMCLVEITNPAFEKILEDAEKEGNIDVFGLSKHSISLRDTDKPGQIIKEVVHLFEMTVVKFPSSGGRFIGRASWDECRKYYDAKTERGIKEIQNTLKKINLDGEIKRAKRKWARQIIAGV